VAAALLYPIKVKKSYNNILDPYGDLHYQQNLTTSELGQKDSLIVSANKNVHTI